MRILPAGAAETPLVEMRALSKSYPEGGGERVVFRDLSVGIRRGETVALLGRSGSGKSTLLNLIAGIDLPTAGEVILDGTNLTGLSEQSRTLFRRRHIGLVFQSFNLIPTLTVMENLLLPMELNGKTGERPRAAGSGGCRTVSARSSACGRRREPADAATPGGCLPCWKPRPSTTATANTVSCRQ